MYRDDLVPMCLPHYREAKRAGKILVVVNFFYYLLFLPLMMLPIVGWAVLIMLSNYKEKLECKKLR